MYTDTDSIHISLAQFLHEDDKAQIDRLYRLGKELTDDVTVQNQLAKKIEKVKTLLAENLFDTEDEHAQNERDLAHMHTQVDQRIIDAFKD